jgi:serine/threonine-protein phosphatase 2A regulatory subunit B
LNLKDDFVEKEEEEVQEEKKNEETITELKIPKVSKGETTIEHHAKKIYANTHAYHINSICLNSDGETFLSADDLRINIWNLNYTSQSFTIVDIKVNTKNKTKAYKHGRIIRSNNLSVFSSKKCTHLFIFKQ